MKRFAAIFLASWIAFSALALAAGPGGNVGSIQFNNGDGSFGAITFGNVGGLNGTVLQPQEAASLRIQITQGMEVDPRFYGAVANAKVCDTLHATQNSPIVSGCGFTSADIGKNIAMNCLHDMGIPTTTILNVDGSGNATLNAIPTGASCTGGNAIWGHDDTTAWNNASAFSAIFRGAMFVVPDNSLIREMSPSTGTQFWGNGMARGYEASSLVAGEQKPTVYILATGFNEDTTKFGINVTSKTNISLHGFEIKGLIFPFTGFGNEQLTLVGTDGGNFGRVDALVLDHMTFSNAWVDVGCSYGVTPSGFMTVMSFWNEYENSAWGIQAKLQDWQLSHDVFTGNFGNGALDMLDGTNAGRIDTVRFEESPNNSNGPSILCTACNTIHFTNSQCQFNGGACLDLEANGGDHWRDVTWTSGFMEGNGVKNASATNAQIIIGSPQAAGGGGLSLENVIFEKFNVALGGNTNYIITGTGSLSTGTVSIIGGNVCTNGYNTALFNWESAAPTNLTVDSADCPQTRLGQSDYSINNGILSVSNSLGVTSTTASPPPNGMYLSLANTLDFSTNSTKALEISTTGNAKFINPPATPGYTVSTLPAGIIGMKAYVTDQTTACPSPGAALTGTGGVTCPVFYNGSAWVGD